MTVALYTHPACLAHDTGPGHPESAERLRAVLEALAPADFPDLIRREAPEATRAEIGLVHSSAYIDRVLAACPTEGRGQLDAETPLSPGSRVAALRAAGAVVAAVQAVLAGEVRRAFCAIRPPGHHAEPKRREATSGFCLFNNIAIGAAVALQDKNCRRVAIVDFDVHHGNGTQDFAWESPNVFYASTHQASLYPFTGFPDESGGCRNILNVQLKVKTGSVDFRRAYDDQIIPALTAFAPDLILISAGFDAHADDPLGDLRLTVEDFAYVTRCLCRVGTGRVVSALEGGYDPDSLAACVAAHVDALENAP
jgi:acetoin utilization deacetylase AcuC-like enzyme